MVAGRGVAQVFLRKIFYHLNVSKALEINTRDGEIVLPGF